MHNKANRLRQAISDTLNFDHIRTRDLGGKASIKAFTDAVVRRVRDG